MGTVAQRHPDRTRPLAWFWEFLKHELAPYPGRAVTVARMVLAATLVMIICKTFRIPYAFLGAIYALLISRESPRATLNSAGNNTGWLPQPPSRTYWSPSNLLSASRSSTFFGS